MGQTFTLDASSNAYPVVNCDQTTFILTNNTGSTIWYRLYLSSNDIDWTDISLAGSSQRLNAGATFSINVQSDGYYKIHYAGSTTVSLSSSSLPSIQTIIKSSPTIITEVSNLDYAICLNSTPTNLSVTANAGSGTISQYAWYSNINNSNVGGSVAVTNINSSTTDFFIPNTSLVGDLYYYPIVSNSYGCSTVGSQSGKITVNALPVVAAITGSGDICVGSTTLLSNATLGGIWSSTSSSIAGINTNGLVTGLLSGTTSISYKFTDLNSCSTTVNKALTVNALPIVAAITGSGDVCVGSTTLLGNTTLGGIWSSTSSSIAGINTSGLVTGLLSGTTSISYKFTDLNSCSTTVNKALTVNALPIVAAITGSGDICVGSTTLLSNATTGGIWSTTSSSIANINTSGLVTGLLAGTTSISYKFTDLNSCSTTVNKALTVNGNPTTPTLTNQTICEGATATITGPTGTYTYTWQVPTGVATSTTNSVITSKAGTYSLTITDANSCSSEVGSAIVTVNPLPAKPTLTNQTICEGLIATITGPTGTYTYTWQVPTGVTASTTNILNTAKAGTYSLTITDANTCSSEVGSATVTVNPLPAKPTLTSQTICEGTTATLTMSAPTGVYTYTWQVPTGVATSITKSVSTSKAGTYSLTITDANSCTSEVGTATVTVNPLPAKPTLTSQTICEGLTATITGPTGTYTYTWQVPTGVPASTTNILSTTKAGTYSLTITDANSCTSDVGTATVVVNALPAKPTLTNPIICEGETASITMSTPTGTSSYTYTWTVPTGVTASTTNILNTTKAGTYSLTITDANNCTSEAGSGVVTVNALPTVTITNPSAVCAPGTVDLTASTITAGSTASLTYTYFTNSTATSTLTNTSLIGSSGTYYIKGTTASNCSAINAVNISINQLPTFNLTTPSVCVGSPLKVAVNPLSGVTTDYDYTWVVPTGVANPGNVSNFTTTIAGVYTATIKNKTTNCTSAPVNNTVSFYALPTAAKIVAADNKVLVNNTLNLTAAASGGSSPYNISWTPNATIYYTISGQENAVFTALKEGKVRFNYQVKDANSCEVSSDEYEITIDPADIILVLPNAFTPNGDGNNDEFKVAASNTLGKISFRSLEIYNRNGKLMFRTEDITQGWNGRYDNVLQDMGVYFVKLVKLNKDGQLVVETSPIYLLK